MKSTAAAASATTTTAAAAAATKTVGLYCSGLIHSSSWLSQVIHMCKRTEVMIFFLLQFSRVQMDVETFSEMTCVSVVQMDVETFDEMTCV